MDIRLLGPLEVDVDGVVVSVGGPRMRRLLASIALANGSVRSIDALVDAVWAGEDPPDGARRTLMSYVSRLRGVVGDGTIEQIEHGYRLAHPVASTDVERFESLVIEGHHTLRAENHIQAAALFEEALRHWRGEPLAEFAGEHWAEPVRARLLNAHLDAIEGRFAARVELGDHAEILGALEREADEHPERERLQFLHMLALYRSGRQTDALGRYESARRHLAAMGLEPSPELRDLEYRILTHDRIHRPVAEEGSVVRGYRLEERLRDGSFGSIYRASQASVGREVAIKVIAPELANDPRFVRRFETEAQLVAHLEHPHIVPLYDFWRDPGGAFLVMRLLRGGSAEDRLRTDGPFGLSAVARIVDEIGGALAAAHARGVVHCDVKPANLLFDEDGRAYLVDFGIAVHGVDRLPVDDGSLRPDVAADVQAFARTIEELMGSSETPCRQEIASAGATVTWSEVPSAVHGVLARANAVDPRDRFGTIADLIIAFRAALAGASIHDVPYESGPVSLDGRMPASVASASLVTGELATLNPYKGLRAFQEADAQDFFGRDRLVDELLARVDRRRLVGVVGASGSGKSSLVRAGLAPLVARRGAFVTTVVPGGHPMEELENGLLRIATGPVPGLLQQITSSERGVVRAVRRILPPDDSELLLVVDQFEEVFTLASDADREAFIAGLVEAVTDDRSRTRVVLTIRADFFDRPLRHRRLGELLQDATLNVVPMSRDELTAAIEGPADRLGVRFEPGLVDSILADVGDGAGVLPLLQYALTELYQHRSGDVMTSASYREIGGVTGALGQRAEDVYDRLDPADQDGARRLFMRLVTPGEGVEDTRRRALRSELTICTDAVIDTFGAHRLLSFDRDPATRAPTVEVAHEALIREWPRLRVGSMTTATVSGSCATSPPRNAPGPTVIATPVSSIAGPVWSPRSSGPQDESPSCRTPRRSSSMRVGRNATPSSRSRRSGSPSASASTAGSAGPSWGSAR
jgi:DNA-binding SARP family transcriptional activator/tRNA A-37 threonylcarbamoyl transferase component Bud32